MHNIESNHLKQNPFLVPSGYFEALPGLVAQKIGPKSSPSFKINFRPILSIAASFILLFGLGYGIISQIVPKADKDPLALESFFPRFNTYLLLNNMDDFDSVLDSEDIITFLTEHGVSHFSIAALD